MLATAYTNPPTLDAISMLIGVAATLGIIIGGVISAKFLFGLIVAIDQWAGRIATDTVLGRKALGGIEKLARVNRAAEEDIDADRYNRRAAENEHNL